MHNSLDLVMWTFNGAKTLNTVLSRINKVIPKEYVNKRFIIDDNSSDDTIAIAKLNGWKVCLNKGKGISDGANTALEYVSSKIFCSFEQDIILSEDWWIKVALPFLGSNYAVASGLRFNSKPCGVNNLLKYNTQKKCVGEAWNNLKDSGAFLFGKTLDNTIYRTQMIRLIGGFPNFGANAGIDLVLACALEKYNLKWKVNYGVHSIHLRNGLKDELHHQRWYGMQREIINGELSKYDVNRSNKKFRSIISLFVPPVRGVQAAVAMKDATICYIYPMIRFYYIWGIIKEMPKMRLK